MNIYFICDHPPEKNSNTRIQCEVPCRYLNRFYKDLNCQLITFKQSENIRDSICFITKFSKKPQVEKLIKNNNKVIYSFSDSYITDRNDFLGIINIVDNVIIPCKEFQNTEYCKNKKCYLIQHISDLSFNENRSFKVGFIGNEQYWKFIEKLKLEDYVNKKIYNWQDPVNHILNGKDYPVHISLRDKTLCFKPATKITCARNFNSLLLCTKDPCFVDMLGDDYKFYVSLNREEIIEKINYLKNIYLSNEWVDLLGNFNEKTKDCSPEIACKKYYDIITTIN
jgi:hypothetical protein